MAPRLTAPRGVDAAAWQAFVTGRCAGRERDAAEGLVRALATASDARRAYVRGRAFEAVPVLDVERLRAAIADMASCELLGPGRWAPLIEKLVDGVLQAAVDLRGLGLDVAADDALREAVAATS